MPEPVGVRHAAVLAAIHALAFPPAECWSANVIALQLGIPGAFGFIDDRGGMILSRAIADEAEVLTLAVAPAARRQGVALDLLRLAMQRAATLGAETMFLEVAEPNEAARALYRRSGFREVGRRLRYYADGTDALVMRAPLAAIGRGSGAPPQQE
ncbi:MAG: GNAT family N-acetyltransferase [Acetobacteraceae bacterium]